MIQWKFKGKSLMTLYLMFRGNKLCRLVLLLVLPPRKYYLIEQPDAEAWPLNLPKILEFKAICETSSAKSLTLSVNSNKCRLLFTGQILCP